MTDSISEEKLQEKADELRRKAKNMKDGVDVDSPRYTGCTGAFCMGIELCADELEQMIEDNKDQ
jgi:hypothetical protein